MGSRGLGLGMRSLAGLAFRRCRSPRPPPPEPCLHPLPIVSAYRATPPTPPWSRALLADSAQFLITHRLQRNSGFQSYQGVGWTPNPTRGVGSRPTGREGGGPAARGDSAGLLGAALTVVVVPTQPDGSPSPPRPAFRAQGRACCSRPAYTRRARLAEAEAEGADPLEARGLRGGRAGQSPRRPAKPAEGKAHAIRSGAQRQCGGRGGDRSPCRPQAP